MNNDSYRKEDTMLQTKSKDKLDRTAKEDKKQLF